MSGTVNRVLFLGNGVNRVVKRNAPYSWNSSIRNLERKYLKMGLCANEAPELSFGLRLQRVMNSIEKSERQKVMGEWLKEVQEIRPNYVHHLLATLVEDKLVEAVMTTNYDFAFEKALFTSYKPNDNEFEQMIVTVKDKLKQTGETGNQGQNLNNETSSEKRQVSVYHIHGAATQSAIAGTKKIIMTMKSYAKTFSRLNRNDDGSWLKLFCEKEVHMCGFSFYAEELVMWEALKQRLEYIRENDVFEELKNRLFVYLFYSDSDKAQQEQLADVLKTYAVEPILIPVGDGDFANAWMTLYGRVCMRLQNLRMTDGDSSVLGRYRYPQHDTLNKNVRAAYCPALYYPHCCKFEVPLNRETKEEFHIWLFYCEVHRNITRWMGLTNEIKKGVEKLGKVRENVKEPTNEASDESTPNGKVYTCFYLDYTSGALFAVKNEEKNLSFVCNLVEIRNAEDFDSLIYPYSLKNN